MHTPKLHEERTVSLQHMISHQLQQGIVFWQHAIRLEMAADSQKDMFHETWA